MYTDSLQPRFVLGVLLALFALTALRVISGFFAPISLQVDEAQYAGWAHHLAAGYYSKPPFIAWALGVGQGVCSVFQIDNIEGCTRMLQAPAFLLAGLLLGASAGQLFDDQKIALFSTLLFLTLPLTSFYTLVATTDAWLLLWWSLALFTFILAQKKPSAWLPWLVCGVAVGLGLLSKYSMALFVVSASLCLWRQNHLFENKTLFQPKPTLLKPLLTGFVAFLVFLPNLVWNVNNGFPTLQHHVDISQVSETAGGAWSVPHALVELGAFFSAQFGVFGPWAFLSLLMISFTNIADNVMPQRDTKAMQFLLLFTWPMLGLILLQATMSRAHANWAVPAYVAGTILVAAFWVRQMQARFYVSFSHKLLFGKRALQASVVLGLALTAFMIVAPHWMQSKPELQTSHLNPLRKLQGWKEVALWVKSRENQNHLRVIADDRSLLAALSVYAYPEAYPPLAWNPSHRRDNHYDWFYDLAKAKLTPQPMLMLLVAEQGANPINALQQSFEQVKAVEDASLSAIEIGGDHRRVFAFEVSGFKGYPK